MRVLVTGTDGFIGSIAGPYLSRRGHEVVGLDTGYYRDAYLYNTGAEQFPACINKDLRMATVADVQGCDAVVHLAELSNDPIGQLNEGVTYDINHAGSIRLARICKSAGVSRFVYMSSCSVYGSAGDDYSTEESPTEPLTAYAECKTRVERDVGFMADDDFSPTFLRSATAFGASPRIRFDLVVNDLSGWAWTSKQIRMKSDGSPWRPFVHIRDISQAIALVIEAPRERIHNQIINVGSNEQNYQIREIAKIVTETFPGCELSIGDSSGDARNYRVNFDKIGDLLPEFRCTIDVVAGVSELLDVFQAVDLDYERFAWRAFTRIKQIRYLLTTNQIDENYYWIAPRNARREVH